MLYPGVSRGLKLKSKCWSTFVVLDHERDRVQKV